VQSQRLIQHTGSAELTIEGKNLKDTLRLLHDGIKYTPLASTDDSLTFILGDNGTNRIYVNGEYSFGVQISGVEEPEGLLKISQGWMIDSDSALINDNGRYNKRVNGSKCINYPFITTENSHFVFNAIGVNEPISLDGLGYYNCSYVNSAVYNAETRINVIVTDATKPAYITYQGFIIAVFNYSA
jgi:hypothetical protein